ncbi:hypothetical protein [Qipengyuania flava]|uniref:hypothetical protein n=1 Tax=Qipengyuania flava TaxID=192812 RepID=UPI00321BC3E7
MIKFLASLAALSTLATAAAVDPAPGALPEAVAPEATSRVLPTDREATAACEDQLRQANAEEVEAAIEDEADARPGYPMRPVMYHENGCPLLVMFTGRTKPIPELPDVPTIIR